MSAPERTQQMQGTAQFLYGTGIPKTLERMSYGDSLFSGAGGLGGTTRMRPETAEAALTVAPFAPAVGRLASRTVRATEGMPVGMGIKDVSPKIGINVNQGGSSFADKIISGEKKFETRESDSLRSYVGKRVGIIRTGEGKAKAIGDVTLGEPIVVSSPEEFAKLRDLHLVPEGSKFDIKEGGVKYLYPIENPVPYGVEKDVAKYGIVSRKILGEPDTLEKAIYPQQAALDLAQQRAALPKDQGGLGLPANNTAADRAKAQGGKEMVHFSRTGGDYTTLDSGKFAIAPFDAVGTHVGTPQTAMERFQNTVGYKVNNPNYANDELRGATYPVTILGDRPLMNQNGMPWGEDDLNAFLRKEGGHNWSDIQGNKMTYQDMNAALRKKLFEEQGYTSIPYFNEVEGKGSISYIVPPENIRSRFAAYDPFRKDVATATAMGVALPDLLAQPVNQYQPTYETIPMYTDPFGNTIGSSIR
jgi:hypothetical protein